MLGGPVSVSFMKQLLVLVLGAQEALGSNVMGSFGNTGLSSGHLPW